MDQAVQYNLLLAASMQISFGINNLPPKVEGLFNQFRLSEIPPIIYMKGKTCSGCSLSIIKPSTQSQKKLIINHDDILHPKGFTSPFNLAIDLMKRYTTGKLGPYFFALEGGIPKNALDCYMANYPICYWVKNAGNTAIASISVGNCSMIGSPDYTNTQNDIYSLKEYYLKEKIDCKVHNIRGCPVKEENIYNTIIDLVSSEYPELRFEHLTTVDYNKMAVHKNSH